MTLGWYLLRYLMQCFMVESSGCSVGCYRKWNEEANKANFSKVSQG